MSHAGQDVVVLQDGLPSAQGLPNSCQYCYTSMCMPSNAMFNMTMAMTVHGMLHVNTLCLK
jgi:hypothetical protein